MFLSLSVHGECVIIVVSGDHDNGMITTLNDTHMSTADASNSSVQHMLSNEVDYNPLVKM